jgi:WD40 repeat protein
MARLLALALLLVADVTPRGDFFRAESAKHLGTIKVGNVLPSCIAFSRDSRRLVVLSTDGRLALWDVGARREAAAPVTAFSGGRFLLSADGTRALGPSLDRRSVRLLDLERGTEIRSFTDSIPTQIQTFALSPDGRRVAIVQRDQSVRLLDVATGDEQKSLVGPGLGQGGSMAWSPDGKLVAIFGWDSTVRYFDAASGEMKGSYAAMGQVPLSMGFSPDSATLVIVTPEARVVLLDRTGKEIRTLDDALTGARSIAFSPDGLLMAANDIGGKTRIWNARTWRHVRDLDTGSARHLAFSPDGRYLAIASLDGRVKFWGSSGGFGPTPSASGYLGIFGDMTESEEKGARVSTTVAGGPAERQTSGRGRDREGRNHGDGLVHGPQNILSLKEGDEVDRLPAERR